MLLVEICMYLKFIEYNKGRCSSLKKNSKYAFDANIFFVSFSVYFILCFFFKKMNWLGDLFDDFIFILVFLRLWKQFRYIYLGKSQTKIFEFNNFLPPKSYKLINQYSGVWRTYYSWVFGGYWILYCHVW